MQPHRSWRAAADVRRRAQRERAVEIGQSRSAALRGDQPENGKPLLRVGTHLPVATNAAAPDTFTPRN